MRTYTRAIRTHKTPLLVQSFANRSGKLSLFVEAVVQSFTAYTRPPNRLHIVLRIVQGKPHKATFLSFYAHLCTLCINYKQRRFKDKKRQILRGCPPFSPAYIIAANQSRERPHA